MQLNIPAALLPTFSATPVGAVGARQGSRPFAEVLSQKQAPPPAAKPAAAPAPSAPPPAKPAQSGAPGEPAAPPAAPKGQDAAAPADPANPATATAPVARATPPSDAPEAGLEVPVEAAEAQRLPAEPTGQMAADAAADARKARKLLGGQEARGSARARTDKLDPAALAREDALRRDSDTRADSGVAPDASQLAGLDPGLARFVADLQLGPRLPGQNEPQALTDAGANGLVDASPTLPAPTDPLAAMNSRDPASTERLEADAGALVPATAGLQQEQRQREVVEANGLRTAEAIGARQDGGRDAAPMPAPLLSAATALAGGPAPTGAAGSAAAAAAPHGVPDFAHTLGAQISVLAREGVQRARLNLHGGEMGAVSVQIVMDGTQAQVHFGADAAATREAIQAGMPDLASALRDAGLTLSGGDVSTRHGREQGGARGEAGDRATRNQRAGGDDRAAEAGHRVPLQRFGSAAGGVDLYA